MTNGPSPSAPTTAPTYASVVASQVQAGPVVVAPYFTTGLGQLIRPGHIIWDPSDPTPTPRGPIALSLPPHQTPGQFLLTHCVGSGTINQVMGQGAQGIVLKVTNPQGITYALKLLIPSPNEAIQLIESKEVTAHAQLMGIDPEYKHHLQLLGNGPIIPLTHDAPPLLFAMVTECGDTSLARLIYDQSQRIDTLHSYLADTNRSVTYLADHQVSHGDIKAGNVVIITRSGQSKAMLIDYSSVRNIDTPSTIHSLTATYPPPSLLFFSDRPEGRVFETIVSRHLDEYGFAVIVAEACGLNSLPLVFNQLTADSTPHITQLIQALQSYPDGGHGDIAAVIECAVRYFNNELSPSSTHTPPSGSPANDG